MKDSIPYDYKIKLLSGTEIGLKKVRMDTSDDVVITFSHGYYETDVIINKEAIEFVMKMPDEESDAKDEENSCI